MPLLSCCGWFHRKLRSSRNVRRRSWCTCFDCPLGWGARWMGCIWLWSSFSGPVRISECRLGKVYWDSCTPRRCVLRQSTELGSLVNSSLCVLFCHKVPILAALFSTTPLTALCLERKMVSRTSACLAALLWHSFHRKSKLHPKWYLKVWLEFVLTLCSWQSNRLHLKMALYAAWRWCSSSQSILDQNWEARWKMNHFQTVHHTPSWIYQRQLHDGPFEPARWYLWFWELDMFYGLRCKQWVNLCIRVSFFFGWTWSIHQKRRSNRQTSLRSGGSDQGACRENHKLHWSILVSLGRDRRFQGWWGLAVPLLCSHQNLIHQVGMHCSWQRWGWHILGELVPIYASGSFWLWRKSSLVSAFAGQRG